MERWGCRRSRKRRHARRAAAQALLQPWKQHRTGTPRGMAQQSRATGASRVGVLTAGAWRCWYAARAGPCPHTPQEHRGRHGGACQQCGTYRGVRGRSHGGRRAGGMSITGRGDRRVCPSSLARALPKFATFPHHRAGPHGAVLTPLCRCTRPVSMRARPRWTAFAATREAVNQLGTRRCPGLPPQA